LNGAHQRLIYADDGNLPVEKVITTKKNAEALLEGGKDFGL